MAAQFKPISTTSSKLNNKTKAEGQFIVTTDDGKIYLDTSSSNRVLVGNSKDTTYSAGSGISIDSSNEISNSGVRSISTGGSNGTISVNTNGTSNDVAVKGLGTAAYTASTDYAIAGHTHSYLPLSGGTVTGDLQVNGSSILVSGTPYLSDGNKYLPFVDGGHYDNSSSSVTGQIQIKLPVGFLSTMMRFTVDIYNYKDNETVSYIIGGYTYGSSSSWSTCSAICIGKPGLTISNLSVRFGTDGTKAMVTIGETNSTWSYVKVRIKDLLIGHSGTILSNYTSGWNVTVSSTAMTTIQKVISNTNITNESISAKKLTNTAAIGSSTLPVYFNASGVPIAIAKEGVEISITGSSTSCTGNAATATTASKVSKALTFNDGGTGVDTGTTYDGSTARIVSYNTIGAAKSSHTHIINDITNLKSSLDSKIDTSKIGVINGVASLDGSGKVPSNQLPSYVDDVIEGYLNNSKFYTTRTGTSPNFSYSSEITGETGKIYVDLTTNKTYRWGGSSSGFVEISESLALGESSSTAYYGDKGKELYDHYGTGVTKGSSTNPIYINNGVPTQCEDTLANNISGKAAKAGTADKLGTSTVGSGTKPIYLNSGTATAFNSTIGSGTIPVYLKEGSITALETQLRKYQGSLSSNGWNLLGGKETWSGITTAQNSVLPNWLSAQYSSTIVFGANNTKGYLDTASATPIVTFGGGSSGNSTNDAPVWYMKFSGKSGATYTLPNNSKTLAANDGSNASGSWGISITGNAATATKATTATTADTASVANTLKNFEVSTNSNLTLAKKTNLIGYVRDTDSSFPTSSKDSAIYQQYYNDQYIHQILGDYLTGSLFVRGKNGNWQSWKTILDSSNYPNYALPLSGGTLTGNLTVKNTSGGDISITFDRGSNNANWKIINSSGHLKFQNDYKDKKGNYFDVFTLDYNTGNASLLGNLNITTGGATFKGRTTHNGKITVKSSSGSYINGKTTANASIQISTKQTSDYSPVLGITTLNDHVFNLGGINNTVGFYGYLASRTANGTDWSFVVDTTTGNWTCNKKIIASGGFEGNLTGNATTSTVTTTDPTSGTWYFNTFASDSGSQGSKINDGNKYYSLQGTASALGRVILQLGNATASGTAGNKYGQIRLYGRSTGYAQLTAANTTGEIDLTLPSSAGTLARTADNVASASKLSNTTAIGSSTLPVYFSANGVPVAINKTGVDISITGSADRLQGLEKTSGSLADIYNINDGGFKYYYSINKTVTGNMPTPPNNANSMLVLSRYSGDHKSFIGFSSDGLIYYKNVTSAASAANGAWNTVAFTSSNVASASKLSSGTVGSNTLPVYFNNGVPTAINTTDVGISIKGSAAKIVAINSNATGGSEYNLLWLSGTTAQEPKINDGMRYYSQQGTTSATGQSIAILGNATASGTSGNKSGKVRLYGTNTYYTDLAPGTTSSNITLTLPTDSGTLARTTDNVLSATKLQTAKTFTIGSSSKTFDGRNNVSWSLTEIGAAASSHTHSYLPLSGGTLTGTVISSAALTVNSTVTANILKVNTTSTFTGAATFNSTIANNSGLISNSVTQNAYKFSCDTGTVNTVESFYLGQWSGNSDGDALYIEILTGDGWNARVDQNLKLDVICKNAYQDTQSTTNAFALTYIETVLGTQSSQLGLTNDLPRFEITCYASAHNTCNIYLLIKGNGHYGGYYKVSYSGGTWTNKGMAKVTSYSGTSNPYRHGSVQGVHCGTSSTPVGWSGMIYIQY